MTPENTNSQSLKNKLLSTTWCKPRYYELSYKFNRAFIGCIWFKLLKRYCAGAQSVLDVGCGEGTILSNLVHPKAQGTGIDISPLAIKLAQNKYPKLTFKIADAENLPFPENSFDFCCNIGTLEHLTNPEKVIEEMIRVTKKDGLLAFWTLNFGSPFVKPGIAPYSAAKKILCKLPQAFYYLLKPPEHLNWTRIQPKITSGEEFVPDNDSVVEPYLQTLASFLKKRNLRIIREDSGWKTTEKESGKSAIRVLAKIANIMKLSALPPFKYWGVNLFIIAQKPTSQIDKETK